MILSLPSSRCPGISGSVPQRRRVIVLGATEAGVSAAFHLGVQALLIDQRELPGTGCGVSSAEHQALAAASTPTPAAEPRRWELPELTKGMPTSSTGGSWSDLLTGLLLLTSAETRLGVRVTSIDTEEHRLTVSTGDIFIYDKLVSTLRLDDFQTLIADEKPGRVHSFESWRYWLADRDIELLDICSQIAYGDVDGQAAGQRVAETIYRAMVTKYAPRVESRPASLFSPRIVSN
jgi:hypothetical protein